MRRSAMVLLLAALTGSSSAQATSNLGNLGQQVTAKTKELAGKIKSKTATLSQAEIIFAVGLQMGPIPGVGTIIEGGLDLRRQEDGTRKRNPFFRGSGQAFGVGVRELLSLDPETRGFGKFAGPLGSDPLYGKTYSLSVPGIFGVNTNEDGLLGVYVNAIPTGHELYLGDTGMPLRLTFSFHLSHPGLVRITKPLAARFDGATKWALKRVDPVVRHLKEKFLNIVPSDDELPEF
jgi:hypothetical protein